MSDNYIHLIPTDPEFIPEPDSHELACELLLSVILAVEEADVEEVKVEVFDSVRFWDAGENLEKILCPTCGQVLSERWWGDAMTDSYRTNFTDLRISMPCCGVESSLNDLSYDFPQGFARFALTAFNPNFGEFEEETKQQFERILGCRLRIIWRRI